MIRRKDRAPWLALAALLLISALVLYHETRGTTLWFDEWEWALNRRGGSLATLLRPHNEHLSLVPVVIYKLRIAIGLAVEVLWKRGWGEVWIVAVPVALYAIWSIGYQHTTLERHAIVLAPGFVASAAASALSALLGLAGPLMPAQGGYSGTLLQ